MEPDIKLLPINAVPTPPAPDGTPKKKNYPPWILGILVLVVAVTVFTFYKFTKENSKIQPAPSPSETSLKKADPTANWKTYTNKNVGFTFKYPANWIENGDSLEEKIGENDVDEFSQKGISVRIYENSGSLNALEFLDTIFYKDYTDQGSKSLKEAYIKQYRENSYLKPATIDGKSVTSIEELIEPHGSDGLGIWITIKENGLLLRSYPSADYQNQQKIFNQILSTFKFIE